MSFPIPIPRMSLIAASALIPADRLEPLRADSRVQRIIEPDTLFSLELPPCPTASSTPATASPTLTPISGPISDEEWIAQVGRWYMRSIVGEDTIAATR